MDSSRERDSTTPEVTSDIDILKDQLHTYQRLNIDLSKKIQECKILLNVANKELVTARNELIEERELTAELKHTLMVSNGHFSQFVTNFVSNLENCHAKIGLDVTLPGSNIAQQHLSQMKPQKPSVDPEFQNQLETICEEDSLNMTSGPRVSSTPLSAPSRQTKSLSSEDRDKAFEATTENSQQAARDSHDDESMNFAGGPKTSSTPLSVALRTRTSSNTTDAETTDNEENTVGRQESSTSMLSALRDKTNISTIPKIILSPVARASKEIDSSDSSDVTDEPVKKKSKGKPTVTPKLVVEVSNYDATDSQVESYINKFNEILDQQEQQVASDLPINEQDENMPEAEPSHNDSSTSSIDSVSISRKRKAKVSVPTRTDGRPRRATRGKAMTEPKLNTKLRR